MKRKIPFAIGTVLAVACLAQVQERLMTKYWDGSAKELEEYTFIMIDNGEITWELPSNLIDGIDWANKPAHEYTIYDEVSYEQLRQSGDDSTGSEQ